MPLSEDPRRVDFSEQVEARREVRRAAARDPESRLVRLEQRLEQVEGNQITHGDDFVIAPPVIALNAELAGRINGTWILHDVVVNGVLQTEEILTRNATG